jgi:4'-phosphopantetheinyl transferase
VPPHPRTAIATPFPGLVLWCCPLRFDGNARAHWAATLSPAERARADRFGTEALRSRYIAGRATLRTLLAEALDTSPAAVPLRRGSRGRPELDLPGRPLDFNVSHTREIAVIAILRHPPASTRVGVDVEHLDRELDADRLARRCLTPRERSLFESLDARARRRRFLRLWTCKEAMSKATGDGLRAPMGELDVELDGNPRLSAGPAPYSPDDWHLLMLDLAGGYVTALALWTRAPD